MNSLRKLLHTTSNKATSRTSAAKQGGSSRRRQAKIRAPVEILASALLTAVVCNSFPHCFNHYDVSVVFRRTCFPLTASADGGYKHVA